MSPTLLEVQGELQTPLVVKNTFIDVDDGDDGASSRKRWATSPDTPCEWDAATSACDGSPMTDLHSSLSSSETPETLTLSSVRTRRASSESETLLEEQAEDGKATANETLDQWPQYQAPSRDQGTSTDDVEEEPATPRQARPGRRSSMMQTQDQWPEYHQAPARSKPAAAAPPAVEHVAAAAPPLNLCQAITNPPLVHPAISAVPPVLDMYGGCHYMPMAGFAPLAPVAPWPLAYHPFAAQAAQWQLQQQLQQQAVLNAMTMPMWDPRAMEGPALTSPVSQAETPKQVLQTVLAEEKPEVVDTSQRKRNGTRRLRLWVHIYLHMKVEGSSGRSFDLVPALIGRSGCHTKRIWEATDAKVRIRGQGSGHLEIDGKYEAPVPLMVAVSTDHQDPPRFRMAVEMTLKEIRRTEKDKFELFLRREKIEHQGPRYSVGLVEKNVEEALGDLLESIPQTGAWHPPEM